MIGGSSPVDQESMGAFQEFPQVHVQLDCHRKRKACVAWLFYWGETRANKRRSCEKKIGRVSPR